MSWSAIFLTPGGVKEWRMVRDDRNSKLKMGHYDEIIMVLPTSVAWALGG